MGTPGSQVVELSVSDLVPHPRNEVFRQMTDEEVAELGESLAEQGFIHPLAVRQRIDGRYQVLSGHQRLRAAIGIGMLKVPCRVVEADDTRAELILLDANLAARKLGPMELARAIRRKKELLGERRGRPRKTPGNRPISGRYEALLSDQTWLSKTQIGEYDALNDLIPAFQALVEVGSLGVTAGALLARLPTDQQSALFETLGETVGQLKVDEVRRIREESRRAQTLLSVLTRRVEELEALQQQAGESQRQSEELQREITRLQLKKRELMYEVQDRLALRRQLERKPGARLLELVVEATRPLAQACPELEALVDTVSLDKPTAANLIPHLQVLYKATSLLERATGQVLPGAMFRRQTAGKGVEKATSVDGGMTDDKAGGSPGPSGRAGAAELRSALPGADSRRPGDRLGHGRGTG